MDALIQREEEERADALRKRPAASSRAAQQPARGDEAAIPDLERAPSADEEGGGFLPAAADDASEAASPADSAEPLTGSKRRRTELEEADEEAAFDAASIADMEAAVHQHQQGRPTAPSPPDKDVLTCNECSRCTQQLRAAHQQHRIVLLLTAVCLSVASLLQAATSRTTCRSIALSLWLSATAAAPSTLRCII